jgi:ferric-dicitrate binding protein FerR (iron transport regulator)
MSQQEYIEKWLNNTLSEQERIAFEQTEDYRKLNKLSSALQSFKAPEFNTHHEFQRLQLAKKSKPEAKVVSMSWLKPLLRIAAVLIVMAGAYFIFLSDPTTTVKTLASQKKEVLLPDGSSATINAGSTLSFNASDWEQHRQVVLEGEAFFKVAKGSRFDVYTTAGSVTVLGTQFNVKSRNNFFEVICYEGKVQVESGDNSVKLFPGDKAGVVYGQWTTKALPIGEKPDWMFHESSFESVPFSEVLDEFERQYNVNISTKNVDKNQLFTGRFVHTDREKALQAITIPLNLTYTLSEDQKTLVLSGEAK